MAIPIFSTLDCLVLLSTVAGLEVVVAAVVVAPVVSIFFFDVVFDGGGCVGGVVVAVDSVVLVASHIRPQFPGRMHGP